MARVVRTSPWDSLMNNLPALAMEWYKTQMNESEKQKERDHDIAVQGLRNESNETTTRMGITGRQALLDDEQLEASGIRQKELDRIKDERGQGALASQIFNEIYGGFGEVEGEFFDEEAGTFNQDFLNQKPGSYADMSSQITSAMTEKGIKYPNEYMGNFNMEMYNMAAINTRRNLLQAVQDERGEFPNVSDEDLAKLLYSQLGENALGEFGGQFGGMLQASKYEPGYDWKKFLEEFAKPESEKKQVSGGYNLGEIQQVGGRYFIKQ